MSQYFVRNLHEKSEGNWIRFWEGKTGLTAGKCHRIGCNATADDGAHVQIVNGATREWYIVPLCHQCNCQFGATFWVEGPLVPVNGGPILW